MTHIASSKTNKIKAWVFKRHLLRFEMWRHTSFAILVADQPEIKLCGTGEEPHDELGCIAPQLCNMLLYL